MLKVIKNTSIYTLGNILPKAVGFLLLPVITRYLTPHDYGIVSSMWVINTILGTLFTLCLPRAIPRLYFDYKNEKDQKDYLGTIFIAIAFISSIGLILVFLFQDFIGKIYRDIPFHPFYTYIVLASFLTVFFHVPKIYLQIKEKPKYFVMLTFSHFLTDILLILLFVAVFKQGAAGQLKASLIAASIFFPVFFIFNLKIINIRFNFAVFKKSLSFSWPFIPTLLCAWVLNWSDRIFIERYFDLHEVGIYSLGYKLAMISLIVTQGFSQAYSPVFFRLANWENTETSRKTLYRYNNGYAVLFLSLCFVIALFAKEAVVLLMDPKYSQAYNITRIIVFSNFFVGLQGIHSLSILQAKKSKQNMYIAIVTAVINIILNFVLILRMGMYGAALATLISFVIGYTIIYLYSKKCYFIPIQWDVLSTYIICYAVLIIISIWLEKNMVTSILFKIMICSAIAAYMVKKIKILKGIYNNNV